MKMGTMTLGYIKLHEIVEEVDIGFRTSRWTHKSQPLVYMQEMSKPYEIIACLSELNALVEIQYQDVCMSP